MASSATRLRNDIANLFKTSCHPDIVLPSGGPQDLTTITLHLLGPASTPYSDGAWKVTLKLPVEYPNSPPKAYFETKIFHPNVAVSTGEVCVDTLKRDWSPNVDLRHVLLVIRCLLIEPNPESALNEEAGKLLLENFADFERMARLMTSIHALKRSAFTSASISVESPSPTDNTDENGNSTTIYSDSETDSARGPTVNSLNTKNVLRPLEHTQRGSSTVAPSSPSKPLMKGKETKPKKKVGIKRL
ncbi:ubiquitin-conjugating enzyme/RWD-like protein [Lipomyces orientalis]|uniref:Ubiquitin-conjugating enzyme/RWD-like protein n=1 Tax=Lipomyces orientalis TaxID=1233043 RepID=A0ACC3TW65_9ASCO